MFKQELSRYIYIKDRKFCDKLEVFSHLLRPSGCPGHRTRELSHGPRPGPSRRSSYTAAGQPAHRIRQHLKLPFLEQPV
jgi:hypothetical protein